MEFLFFLMLALALMAIFRKPPRPPQLQLPPDFFGTHAASGQEVERLGPGAALIPARTGEAHGEWQAEPEADAVTHDQQPGHAVVVSLEDVTPRSVAPRRLPTPPMTLEVEVDRGMEHERFHRRYVDARPAPRPTAASLLDELRNPDGARRAVLLAEILAPPVSMRE